MRNHVLRCLAVALAVGLATSVGPAATAQGTDAERLPPLVVRTTPDYDLEVVAAGEGPGLAADIRRTDLYGNSYPGLDGFGYITSSGWGDIGGRRCLAVSTVGLLRFPNTTDRNASYGLVGTDVARIELTLTDSTEIVARRGRARHDGFRAWIAIHPASTFLQRAVAYDATGRQIATVDNLDQSAGFGLADICRSA